MTTTRIQLNSNSSRVDVFKKFPSAELDKNYVLKVENMNVPAIDVGLLPNEPLFTLERRLERNSIWNSPDNSADRVIPSGTFTPDNVRSASQLVFQINSFLDEVILKMLTYFEAALVGPNQNADLTEIPDAFDINRNIPTQQDWYDILLSNRITLENGEHEFGVHKCVRCFIRSDGRIGFTFTQDGWIFFVLHLTDRAKHMFGFEHDFVAVDQNGYFSEYLVENPVGVYTVDSYGDPHNLEPFAIVFDNIVFSHEKYRHEIVLTTTLPLHPYIDCESKKATFQQQLCTYKYPETVRTEEYKQIYFRKLGETWDTNFVFEHGNKTHNEFYIRGTQLQNFHIRLMLRSYEYNSLLKTYNRLEVPYPLQDDSFWSVTFNVKLIS